jgi:hypothetical protein
MIIAQENLYDFMAELWNNAKQTGGNSRFLHSLSCWLESCPYKELPKYMKDEYDRGRIIIYPKFPKRASVNMEKRSVHNLLMRVYDYVPKGSMLQRDIERVLKENPK